MVSPAPHAPPIRRRAALALVWAVVAAWIVAQPVADVPVLRPMTKEQAAVFPFTPPLGINEAIALLARLRMQGRRSKAEVRPNADRQRYMGEALDEVASFVRALDRRFTTLDRYDWELIGQLRVLPGEPAEAKLRPDKPLRNVSAIALRARRGRVLVEDVRARDADEHPLAVDMGGAPYLVLQSLPKREVCFLYYPEAVAEVTMRLSTDVATRATLEVYAGSSRHEEHGKLALYHMARAASALDAKRFVEFDAALHQAERALIDFRWTHGL